jgi:hypothetical protein
MTLFYGYQLPYDVVEQYLDSNNLSDTQVSEIFDSEFALQFHRRCYHSCPDCGYSSTAYFAGIDVNFGELHGLSNIYDLTDDTILQGSVQGLLDFLAVETDTTIHRTSDERWAFLAVSRSGFHHTYCPCTQQTTTNTDAP